MKICRIIAEIAAITLCSAALFAQSGGNLQGDISQTFNPVITGGHILTIAPDARAAGMGDIGLTTSADAYAQFHNLSKLPLTDKQWGVSLSYTPWMVEISKDMSLSSLNGYFTWGDKNSLKHAVAASFRYFHIGNGMAFFSHLHTPVAIKPYELAFDAGYALKFHKNWSVGAGVKYLRSDYNYSLNGVAGMINSVLFDLSSTFETSISLGAEKSGVLRAALALNNLGGKMSYDGGLSYLYSPAIFRLGVGMETDIEPLHHISGHFELSKMLAPTYPVSGEEDYEKHLNQYQMQNGFAALFSSWTDAPGGFPEEMKEIMLALGAEYRYDQRFFLRAGYKHQHKSKGTGAGVTLGAGVKYQMMNFDISYFLATQPNSPLNNTLRLTLGINL